MRGRYEVTQWLMWQMGGLGPMAGQANHFRAYAPEKIPYAIDRYTNEVNRLFGVMDRRLADREYLAGEYSIADMACFPWILPHERMGQNLGDFPHLQRLFHRIEARPAVQRRNRHDEALKSQGPAQIDDEAKKILFGQNARTGQTP